MKVSECTEKDLKTIIMTNFNNYHRDLCTKFNEEDKDYTMKRIYEYIIDHAKNAHVGIIENVFNPALFETNYKMSFSKFCEKFKLLNTEKIKSNETRTTQMDYDHVNWIKSPENKELVKESINLGKVINHPDKPKTCFSLDELKLVDRETYDNYIRAVKNQNRKFNLGRK